VDAARSLAPLIEAEADAAELATTLTAPVVEALRASRLPWIAVPAELGGAEVDLPTTIDVIEEVTRADGSTGWTLMAAIFGTGPGAAWCGQEAVETMFADPDDPPLVAGMPAPLGTAARIDGGYRFSGRFGFGSGIAHSNWIMGGAAMPEVPTGEYGMVQSLVCLVPRSRVELLGNWEAVGMIATGSYDYAIPEQLVPEPFTYTRLRPVAHRGGPRYHQLGLPDFAATGHLAVALGLAKRGLEELVAVVDRRARPGVPVATEQQIFRHGFMTVEAKLRSARAYTCEVYGDVEATLAAGDDVSPEQHDRIRQAATHVTTVAMEVLEFCFFWAGSAAFRTNDPSVLDRCYRDTRVAANHIYVDHTSLVNAATSVIRSWRRD
jgi:alkylation response protein AidB-like acyl-CoA dehydrogenase